MADGNAVIEAIAYRALAGALVGLIVGAFGVSRGWPIATRAWIATGAAIVVTALLMPRLNQ